MITKCSKKVRNYNNDNNYAMLHLLYLTFLPTSIFLHRDSLFMDVM